MKVRHALSLLAIAITPSLPRLSGACSPPLWNGGDWQEQITPGDTRAPTQVTASYRIDLPTPTTGCGTSDCGVGFSHIVLSLSAVDDVTPPGMIGYRLTVLGGRAPSFLDLRSTPMLVEPYSTDEIGLRFGNEGHPFSFDLEVVAVDGNGNASEPVVITIDG